MSIRRVERYSSIALSRAAAERTLATRELGRVAYHRTTVYCSLESTVGTVTDKYVDVEQADDVTE